MENLGDLGVTPHINHLGTMGEKGVPHLMVGRYELYQLMGQGYLLGLLEEGGMILNRGQLTMLVLNDHRTLTCEMIK